MENNVKKEIPLSQYDYNLLEKRHKEDTPKDFIPRGQELNVLGGSENVPDDSKVISDAITAGPQAVEAKPNDAIEMGRADDSDSDNVANVLSVKLGTMAVKIKDEFFALAQALTNKIMYETEALFESVKEDPIGHAGAEVQAYSQQGQRLDSATQNSIVQRTVAHQKAASKNADLMFRGIQIASRDLGAKGYGYIGEGSAYMSQFKEWVQKGFTPTDNASERAEMEYYIKGLQGR